MPSAWFGPCPHCKASLSYLEGVTGITMSPKCPCCHEPVPVSRATFLTADHSRLSLTPKPRALVKPK